MSSSAATPSASSCKATGSGRVSSVEPSPASTYGESAASDAGDGPQTPVGENDEGVLLKSAAKLSINDGKSIVIERYSPPFVRKGIQSSAEDPFTATPSRRGSAQVTPTGPKFTGRAAKSDNWRSGSSSGSSAGRSSPSPTHYLVGKRGNTLFVKEFENENDIAEIHKAITPEAAQAIFPPACCVFVANLLQSETDEALEVAVTEVFREFGSVWVKIRRDPKHMPFAFCQYRFPEESERAIREGRGRLIKGRPCRCEKAKAHRLFFIERKYGTVITPEEVAHLLRGFGKLDFIRPATPFELAQFNLNEGILVQFQMYDDGQAALQAYRNHEVYKMQSMANMCSPARSAFGGHSNPADRQYLETYEVDKRSVFVGNLPVEILEIDLQQKFEKYGAIRRVTLHKNESTLDSTQKHCFAFIEFAKATAVPSATEEMHGSTFLGKTIRVSQKDSEAAKKRRGKLPSPAPTTSYQSPSQHSIGQQPVTPMTHVSPSGYGSPYTFPYGGSPYYGYPGTGYYADAQGQYYPVSPYSYSPFYAYTGSSSYASGTSSSADAAGSPTAAQPYYGYYSGYGAPYWGYSSPAAQQPTWYAPAYSPPAASTVQEDRPSTPTPTGHTSTAESSMESQ